MKQALTDDSNSLAIKLSRVELWLLYRTVEVDIPIHILGYTRGELEMRLNVPNHGASIEAIARCLTEMHERGWVRLPALGSESALLDVMRTGRRSGCYGLTEAGGEVWTAFTGADWDRYIEHSSDGEGLQITCRTERLVRQYLRLLAECEGTPALADAPIARIHHWRATNWKQFDHAYRAHWTEEPHNICARATLLRNSWVRWR